MKNEQTSYLSPKLEACSHPEKGGWGVYARELVKKGELLMIWGGDLISRDKLEEIPPEIRRYAIQVDDNLFLASRTPQPEDYINHCCDPNAGLNSQNSLVALRDIEPGEEVCFDYAMSDGCSYDEFECACNSPLCRGRITGTDWAKPELWSRYAGHFSPYLQRRINRLRATVPDNRVGAFN